MGLRFLALACLVGAAFAGPVQRPSESQCSKQCKEPTTKNVVYKPHKAYIYKYESENNISYAGDPKQKSGMAATVEIHVVSQCEFMLKMKDIRIEDQKMSQDEIIDFKTQLEIPMTYRYSNGKFEDICPSPDESTQSLNVKKACISAFSNWMSDPKISQKVDNEKDSFGVCQTSYTVEHQSGEKLYILKEKNLATCSNRQAIINTFINQKLPSPVIFEKGVSKCEQQLENGIFSAIDCHETEKMKTISKEGDSLIKFSGHLRLKLLEIREADKREWQEPFSQEEIFYGIEESRNGDRNVKEIKRILRDMCAQNTEFVNITIGKEFLKLLPFVKSSSYQDLEHIYESLKDGSLCSSKKVRDVYADTLPVTRSDAAIKLMVNILLNEEVSWLKSKLWIASLAMKRNPTKHTAAAIVPLLKKDQSQSTLLAAATMIRHLCDLENCDRIDAVGEIIAIFNSLLGSKCSSTDLHQIKRAITFFRNVGYQGEAYKNILACAKDQSKPIRIRLQAINSFRLLKTKPHELLRLYSKPNEDSEVRIAAFYEIFSHCDEKQLKYVKEVAEKERDEQVTGFVLSHLRNMNKTSSPKYSNIKYNLQRIGINPPEVNYWKNSKIIEMSAYNKALRVGGLFETGVIHSNTTKLPKSIFGNIVTGKDFEVAQAGIRFEGFDEILQNIIPLLPSLDELREKISKKPSLDEIKAELSHISLDKIFGHNKPGLDMFVSIFNTEVLRFATADMSSLDQMLKMADLMTKLAREKDVDFSHSVVIMNSKLIIPSMTGRSYSIGVTGTSTVALTAKTKADLLNLPRNADVHVHLRPSVAVEFSTTCGILTNSHEKHMKIATRMHMQANADFKLVVKDRHIATITVGIPSEDIFKTKMSTNIYEMDENHIEKPMIKKLQKKIDYCFNLLEKPLGLSACGKVEVSNPLVLKEMPYVMPFGNIYFALKKTDPSFSEYKCEAEIPKQIGPNMKFKAYCNTPGSKISRKFASKFEIKQDKDQKNISLELTCPFKTVGASGLFTKNDKFVQGVLEMHISKKQIGSLNITAKVAATRSRKTYEVFGAYSILNKESTKINGSATVVKGKKHHLFFDIRTNRPKSKPLALKGSIVKEGIFDNAPRSEYKASCELSLKSPIGDFNVRKTIEKRSKPSRVTSANVGIDYQLTGKQKHTVTISGTSQRSSNKVITNVKVDVTQNPSANILGTWHMQRESSESVSNDITLKYGPKLDETLVHLKQKSRMPKTGLGHCSAILEIPGRDLHYELTLDHEINLREMSKVYVKADFCNKKVQHYTSLLDFYIESKRPLKASARLDIQHPGGHYILENKMEIVRNNEIVGIGKVQYRPQEDFQWNYRYKKLSDHSKFHHEIESSIQTPFTRNPVTGKASVELSSQSLAVAGQVGPDYWLRAHLNEDGESEINIKSRLIEGTLKTIQKDRKNTLLGDFKVNVRKPRHVVVSAASEFTHKTKLEFKVQTDADRHPEEVISACTEFEPKNSGDSYESVSKLHVLDLLDMTLAETGELSILGDQKVTVKLSIKNQDPVVLRYRRKTGEEHAEMTFTLSKRDEEILNQKFVSNWMQNVDKKEFSVEYSLVSPVVNIYSKQILIYSESLHTTRSTLSITRNNRVYKTEWNSDIHLNGLELKAQMHTPHVSFEKSAVGFSFQRSDSAISSVLSFEYSDNKKISIQTAIQAQQHGHELTCKFSTPYEPIKDAQINVVLEKKQDEKSLKAVVEVDKKRACRVEGIMSTSSRETEFKGSIKVFNNPKLLLQDLNVQYKCSPSSALLSGNVELKNNKKFSLRSEIKQDGSDISTTSSIVTPYEDLKDAELHLSIKPESSKKSALCYVSVNGKKKGELSIASSPQVVDIKGRLNTLHTPEVSAHLKSEKAANSFSISANIMKSTSPLLSVNLNRLSHANGEKLLMQTKTSGKTLLDVEVSQDDHWDNSKQISFKASGEFPAVSVTFSERNSDHNSLSTELRVCKGDQSKAVCHSLKSSYKSLVNAEGHRLLERLIMDVEKSEGRSNSRRLGRLHLSVSVIGNDYKLKSFIEADEKKIGCEHALHIRLHKNERCSLDSIIYLPKFTSKFSGSVYHNEKQLNLEADVIPRLDDSNDKLSLQIKRENNPRTHERSGLLKLTHSRWSQPMLLSYKLQPVEQHYVKGKVVIHSGPVGEKSIVLEALPDIQNAARSMLYKVSIDEKSVATCKLFRQRSRHDDTIGYEWKYVSPDGEKTGGLSLVFFDKNGGIPKSLKIKWSSPSADYEVLGSVAQAPNDIILNVASNGQKLQEVRVSCFDSCVRIEGLLAEGEICINKREGSQLQLLKATVQYRQHKCVNFKVVVDPEDPDYILVVYKPSQDESCKALWEIVNLDSILHGYTIKELKQRALQQLKKLKKDVLEPFFKKWKKAVWDVKEDISFKVKDQLKQHDKVMKECIKKFNEIKKNLLRRIQSAIPESIKEACRKYSQKILKRVSDYCQKFQETLKQNWPAICEVGWYCTDITSAIRHFDAQEAKALISRKIDELKNDVLQFKLPKFRFIYPSDIMNLFKSVIYRIKGIVDYHFGGLIAKLIESVQYVKVYLQKVETYFRQKAIDVIDEIIKRVHHIFSEDQDLQNAQQLILKAKAEVIKAWENKEEIAQNSVRRVENSIKQNVDEFLKNKFQVLKSDPRDGEYVVKIRQPLTKSDAEDIKHELIQLIGKLQDYIRSLLRLRR